MSAEEGLPLFYLWAKLTDRRCRRLRLKLPAIFSNISSDVLSLEWGLFLIFLRWLCGSGLTTSRRKTEACLCVGRTAPSFEALPQKTTTPALRKSYLLLLFALLPSSEWSGLPLWSKHNRHGKSGLTKDTSLEEIVILHCPPFSFLPFYSLRENNDFTIVVLAGFMWQW